MIDPKRNDDFMIAVSDLASLCRKAKRKIFLGIATCSILGLLYAIQQPIKYEAKATFREKFNNMPGMDSASIAGLIFSGNLSETDSSSISTLKSRTLIERVSQNLGLQGTLEYGWNFPTLRAIKDNIITEITLLSRSLKPALKDPTPLLSIKQINYPGEVPIFLKIHFISNSTYEVYYQKKKIGEGKLNTSFKNEDLSFTLYSNNDHLLESKNFTLRLDPMYLTLKKIIANLKIIADNDDSTLLKITYYNPDRHLASAFVNQLMATFQQYLKEDQQRITAEQITYLQAREEETSLKLKNLMESYGKKVSNDVYHLGFARAETALDFLTKQQLVLEEKTIAIDLALKRLVKAQESGETQDIANLLEWEEKSIQTTLNAIRELKQDSDSIELALRNSPIQNKEELKAAFIKQIYDLEEVRSYADETQSLVASLEQGTFPPPSEKLFSNPHFLAKEWYDKLLRSRKTASFEDSKTQYINYLTNLSRYLEVQEKTISERLAHQQGLQLDFQGINLQTAKELYHRFSTSLNQIESEIAERKFILMQIKEPGFEISSLSNILKDPISGRMIESASQIVLQLNDDRNRSDMEKERLRKDLAIKNKFLTLHLNQNLQLLALHESLLKEKIYSIQSTTLELIHQKISVLEKQLSDFVALKIESLQQEKQLLAQHRKIILSEMAKLPEKWVNETLVQQHLKINEKMVEEITKLVESKNIAKNLEIVQSAPLDLAHPSVQPRSPKLILFAVLGAFLGAFLMVSSVLAKTIYRGIPVSQKNLEIAKVHVAGTFTEGYDNLEILRQLNGYFANSCCLAKKSLLILKGHAPDYSKTLAQLLDKQGNKVVMISLDFNEKSENDNLGLLSYLEGKISSPKITQINGLDTILSGGYSPYGYELAQNKLFDDLINNLKLRYDWVIVTCSINPDTGEAQGLIPHFDCIIVNVQDEILQDLAEIIDIAKDEKSPHRISFVIIDVLRHN